MEEKKAAVRFRSIQGEWRGSCLEVIQGSHSNPEPFKFCILHSGLFRMGVTLKFPSWLGDCECGKPLDDKGFHLLSYKFVGDQCAQSHQWIADGWSELLRELGVHHKQEPSNRYVGVLITTLTFFCLMLIWDVLPNWIFHWHIHGAKTI